VLRQPMASVVILFMVGRYVYLRTVVSVS
jgi:hypothetical protein